MQDSADESLEIQADYRENSSEKEDLPHYDLDINAP